MLPRSTPPPSLETLNNRSHAQLKALYVDVFGRQPPGRSSREFLMGNLAWAIQARLSGMNPEQLRTQLTAKASGQPVSKKVSYLPGTRLIREWQGVTHEVIVEADGYRWQHQHYRSLSHIARQITGAHWSGPRFFGLKPPLPEKAKKPSLDLHS